jgi:hypothetical protein
MLKKISLFLATAALLLVPVLAQAQYGAEQTAPLLGYGAGNANIYGMLATAASLVLSMLAIVFFGFMLYAGIRWMTARGNEELAEKAKNTLINATLGFAIVALSYALTRFVLDALKL